jgi:tetratricopeptide (TPR) repeat protein
VLATSLACAPAFASESSDELVRQARAHEAANEDDVAARRYTEALTIDSLNPAAWLGLAELRLRAGEAREADRVYTAALARLPLLTEALKGRAHARWTCGLHAEAEADLEAFADASGEAEAYHELAGWFGTDGRTSAELATWRLLLAMPPQSEAALSEAHRMVRALTIVVGSADPACFPIDPSPTRFALSRLCTPAPVQTKPPSIDPHGKRRHAEAAGKPNDPARVVTGKAEHAAVGITVVSEGADSSND